MPDITNRVVTRFAGLPTEDSIEFDEFLPFRNEILMWLRLNKHNTEPKGSIKCKPKSKGSFTLEMATTDGRKVAGEGSLTMDRDGSVKVKATLKIEGEANMGPLPAVLVDTRQLLEKFEERVIPLLTSFNLGHYFDKGTTGFFGIDWTIAQIKAWDEGKPILKNTLRDHLRSLAKKVEVFGKDLKAEMGDDPDYPDKLINDTRKVLNRAVRAKALKEQYE